MLQGLLADDRARRLSGLGFVWQPGEARWEERFAELVAFKQVGGGIRKVGCLQAGGVCRVLPACSAALHALALPVAAVCRVPVSSPSLPVQVPGQGSPSLTLCGKAVHELGAPACASRPQQRQRCLTGLVHSDAPLPRRPTLPPPVARPPPGQEHGHCNVPKGWPRNQGLATWVEKLRTRWRARQGVRPLSHSREARLRELG